jgi:ribosomal protein S18 acetylase RimI-like enzyme
VELRPSTELSRADLARLFTAAYEGYFVPFAVDEARLAHMVDAFDIALDRSLVAYEGNETVGLANLGLRGDRTWLGGVGVVQSHRRRGIGEELSRALLDQARAAGAREMVLEVIDANAPAIALYEKLGFETTRRLEVFTLPAEEGADDRDGDLPEARARIAAARTEPEPWQRDDATLDNLDGLGAVTVDGADAVYRLDGRRVDLLQAAGDMAALLPGLRAKGSILALNFPEGGPVAVALRDAGATHVLTQREMIVAL